MVTNVSEEHAVFFYPEIEGTMFLHYVGSMFKAAWCPNPEDNKVRSFLCHILTSGLRLGKELEKVFLGDNKWT